MPPARHRAPPRDGRTPLRASAERRAFAVWRRWRWEAQRSGLTLPQFVIVSALHRSGPVPLSRRVESSAALPSTITGHLDGLEETGWILRHHEPTDRRQVTVRLSPRGRQRTDELEPGIAVRWRSSLRPVPAGQTAMAAEVLAVLAQGLGRRAGRRVRAPPPAARAAGGPWMRRRPAGAS